MTTPSGGPGPILRRCGDTGWLVELADNDLVHRWAAAVRAARLSGVDEVVPGHTTLLVNLDPAVTTSTAVRAALADLEPAEQARLDQTRHVVEVRYDGDDLAEVAALTALSPAQVIDAHTATPWRVAFCGFAPGFSYLVGGDPRLRVPRRDEARIRVPAGAVALAGEFSAIYPRASPGGWQLLGRTTMNLWDSTTDPPAVLLPGDIVQFRAVPAP